MGWVQYRAGKWKASIAALELSDKLQEGGTGDAFQWLFLAMAQRQLGDRGAANRWYDKAAQTKQVLPEELRCFQAEAEQLLGVNAGNKDIAILDLSEIAPSRPRGTGADRYGIFLGNDGEGRFPFAIVGYGQTGTGQMGATQAGGVKRHGRNIYEVLGDSVGGP